MSQAGCYTEQCTYTGRASGATAGKCTGKTDLGPRSPKAEESNVNKVPPATFPIRRFMKSSTTVSTKYSNIRLQSLVISLSTTIRNGCHGCLVQRMMGGAISRKHSGLEELRTG
jgi:hypothetical protein